MLALMAIFIVPFIGLFVYELLVDKNVDLKTDFFVYIQLLLYSNLISCLFLSLLFNNSGIENLLNTSSIFFIQYICFMLAFNLILSFIFSIISKYADVYIEEINSKNEKK